MKQKLAATAFLAAALTLGACSNDSSSNEAGPTTESTAAATPTPDSSAAPAPSALLNKAISEYIGFYFVGDVQTAYARWSTRCTQAVDLPTFTTQVNELRSTFSGEVPLLTSISSSVSGDVGTATLSFEDESLNEKDQKWLNENGIWRFDNC